MLRKKSSLILLLTTAMLASCGGGSSAVSSATSSQGTSSQTTGTSSRGGTSEDESSEGTSEESSQEPSSELTSSEESSEESSVPSTSFEPVTDVFNVCNFTHSLIDVLDKYRPGVLSFDEIRKAVEASGEVVDFDPASSTKLNEAVAMLVYAEAFKKVLPERIGARSFQGFYFDADKIEIRKAEDPSTGGAIYKAIEYLGQTGIVNLPATSSLSTGKAYAVKNFNKIVDRIHAYFGESKVDDFFSAVNHDYLYDDNPNVDVPSDGRKSWDEPYDEENLSSIYDSRLIPEEEIVEWALEFAYDIPSVSNFISTYTDWDARSSGNAAGLVAGINKYLGATTADEFIEVCKEMVEETGYCILWSEADSSSYSLGGKPLLWLTSYSYSDSSSAATSNRATSISRFSPIFTEALDCDEEVGKQYATDYSDFKIQMAKGREGSKVDDTLMVLTDDSALVEQSPKLYFTASFGNGASVGKFFNDLGFEDGAILANSAKDLTVIANLIKDDTLALVKGLAIWQMLQHYTICLPNTPAVNAWAWKPGYSTDAATLWDNKAAFYVYGMPYISRNISNFWLGTDTFTADSNAVIGIVTILKEALLARIERADWVSDDAKAKAALKVNELSYSIGGKNSNGTTFNFEAPEYLDKDTGTLYGNIGLSEAVTLNEAKEKCGKTGGTMTFDQAFALSDPLTANAFYMPSYNAINITLGYMACYDGAGEASFQKLLEDYGWVVGHEISHGFDSNGIYYDEKGTKHAEGWFLPEDADAYSLRCRDVADYYDGYEVMPEQKTDGTTVMTEAIADINGLHTALEAAKGVSDFDYAHFFEANAKHFASYSSQYTYVGNGLAADEHPFGRARVNLAMKAMDEWHEAFGTKEGDAMWVAPEDRIAIW
ncbi:MAG: hypothetical protein IJS37_02460 [Bacilli bacterium]|nr:hypothetical protein [Bacilli bacterium]